MKRALTANGFSLIELLIVLAVLAALIMIALPVYTQQITRTHRAEGKSALIEAAMALERCQARFSTYDDPGCEIFTRISDGMDSPGGHYRLTFANPPGAQTFTLKATPQGPQAERERWCGSFTLAHTGGRGMEDAPAGGWDAQRCWN